MVVGERAMIVWKDMSGLPLLFFSLSTVVAFQLCSSCLFFLRFTNSFRGKKDVKVATFEGIPSFVLSRRQLEMFLDCG
jgi:hypothetical protein